MTMLSLLLYKTEVYCFNNKDTIWVNELKFVNLPQSLFTYTGYAFVFLCSKYVIRQLLIYGRTSNKVNVKVENESM